MRAGDSSFRELFLEGQRVEIPVIQRDYAQGREDEHSREVRKHFIEALGTAFSPDRPDAAPLDLDFVYGRSKVSGARGCADGSTIGYGSWSISP